MALGCIRNQFEQAGNSSTWPQHHIRLLISYPAWVIDLISFDDILWNGTVNRDRPLSSQGRFCLWCFIRELQTQNMTKNKSKILQMIFSVMSIICFNSIWILWNKHINWKEGLFLKLNDGFNDFYFSYVPFQDVFFI